MAANPQRRPATSESTRRTLLSLYIPAFILAMGLGIATPALPVYAKSFDVSFGAASLVVIMYLAGATASSIPTGYLIDRVGRRKVVLIGPVLVALASFLVATAHSFPELLFYRFLGGWASQMWLLGRIAIITDIGGAERGRHISGMFGTDAAGRLVGPAIGGFVAAAWDIRVPFVLHGVLALLSVIPNVFLIKETRAPSRTRTQDADEKGRDRVSVYDFLTGYIMLLFACQVLAFLARGLVYGQAMDIYTVYAYNVGPETIGLLAVAASATGIPLTFYAGHLLDRIGRKPIIISGFCVLAVAMGVVAITAHFTLPFWVFVPALLCVHASTSFTSGCMQTLGSDVAPPHARGTFFGLWRLAGDAGMLLSPVSFALLSEHASYAVGFLFLSAASLATALLAGTQVKETLEPKASPRSASQAPV